MKKFLISIFAIGLLFVWGNYVWATAVGCTKTDWGYTCTGGTTVGSVIQDTWVTATAYTVGQKVSHSGFLYLCTVQHTSGTFATDLAAGDWRKIGNATVWVTQANFYPANSSDISQLTASASNWNAATFTPSQAGISFSIYA